MLRKLATTFLVVAVWAATGLADAKMGGVARQISMGGASALGVAANPFIFNDPVFQYINPAYQQMYKDYAWMNIGGGTTNGMSTGDDGYGLQNAGANFSLGDGLALGTILSHDPSAANTVLGALGGNSGLFGTAPVEVLELVGSFGSDNIHFGLGLLYGWTMQNSKSGTVNNEINANVLGVRGGVYVDLTGGNAVEGSVAFRTSSAEDIGTLTGNPPGAQHTDEASATEILVAARAKLRVNNKVNFIPVASFASGSGDATIGGQTAGETTVSALAVGVGADVTVGDFYMAGGVSYAMATNELITGVAPAQTTTTNTTTAFPAINIGGEWTFTDWLTGRAGYVRAFTNWKTEIVPPAPGVTTETNYFGGWSIVPVGNYNGDNLVVLGLAANWGNFALEATVSEAVLRRGFGIIGSSDNINTFGFMNASYNFE